ncbi:MAG: dTDP-4-dehydrorhamnose reductase [Hyphomicrobiales bacterium]
MRLAVTGRTGQLACALIERAALTPAIEVVALGRPDLDLERPETVAAAIRAARPDLVVNAAAFTAVDRAEAEPERAFAVNRDGAAAVARAAAALNAPFIQLSTDYVFAGLEPGAHIEADATGPVNVYGSSKLAGEIAVREAHPGALILRTSWLYSPFGTNFVKTMLRLGRERHVLRVVDDQWGNPTSALDLADAILRLAPRLAAGGMPAGTFHLAGAGATTWCRLARYIFEISGAHGGPRPEVAAISTADYPAPARRPPNSRLDCAAFAQAFGFALDPWQRSVEPVVQRLLAEAQ